MTSQPWRPAKRPRKHFEHATTIGTMLGPLGTPTTSEQWLLSFGDKKRLYGADLRIPVDGITSEDTSVF